MQICPEDTPIYVCNGMQQVMMIVPVNSQKYETKYVTQKYRDQWSKRSQVGSMRCLQLEHHDSDDDRDHPIAECFHSVLGHWFLPSSHDLRMPGLFWSIAKYSWISFAYRSLRSETLRS